MTCCIVTGKQCVCQPDEGVPCPAVAELRAERDKAIKAVAMMLDERDALKAQLAAPVTEAEIRARNDGRVTLGKGVVLILAEELAAFKEDSERLDWAESHPEEAMHSIMAGWIAAGKGFRETEFIFRIFIDAARMEGAK
jgi:hypothetical protein